MRRVPWKQLSDWGVRYLTRKGMPEAAARYVSEIAIQTEAWGISTHGVRVFSFFERRFNEDLDPKAEPVVVKETAATALIDGTHALGQLAMRMATDIGIRKAREAGSAVVGVRLSYWIAGLAVYMIPIVEAGLLGHLCVQHSSGKDCAPFGGTETRLSTNPVAFAFPLAEGAMISDFSTSIVSMGKVARMLRHDELADDELFLDREGRPTDDPKVVRDGGSLLFTGGVKRGYKGFAMSLWAEALTAMAGGQCNDTDSTPGQNFTLMVIDPEAFAGSKTYLRKITRLVAYVKSSRLRAGSDGIRIAGERGFQSLEEARAKGVLLDDESVERLNEVAHTNGLETF